MILVATNVISEPLRKAPHTGVIEWIDAQPLETLYLSAITVAELRIGVAALPVGKRRNTPFRKRQTEPPPLFLFFHHASQSALGEQHSWNTRWVAENPLSELYRHQFRRRTVALPAISPMPAAPNEPNRGLLGQAFGEPIGSRNARGHITHHRNTYGGNVFEHPPANPYQALTE
jgi:hypothetical protein